MTKSNGSKGSSNLPVKTGGNQIGKPLPNLDLISQGVDAFADISKNVSNAYVAKQAYESIKSQSKVDIRKIEESNETSRVESDNNLKIHQANIQENIVKINRDEKQDEYKHKQRVQELDNESLKIKTTHEEKMSEIKNQNSKKSTIEVLEDHYRLLQVQFSSNTLNEEQKLEVLKEMKDIREKLLALHK